MIGESDEIEFIDPIWLSHHRRGEEDRCARVGGRFVCRRCIVLWPLTFLAMTLSLTIGLWPEGMDPLMLAILPLPAVAELVQELRGRLAYDRVRQSVLMVPLAAAIGRGSARYLEEPGDPLFWAMALGYGAMLGVTALRQMRADR